MSKVQLTRCIGKRALPTQRVWHVDTATGTTTRYRELQKFQPLIMKSCHEVLQHHHHIVKTACCLQLLAATIMTTNSLESETQLTDAEYKYFGRLGYYISNLNHTKVMDCKIFAKKAKKAPFDIDVLANMERFVQHPDTKFMLAPSVSVLPVPKPTEEYLQASLRPSERLEVKKPVLVILDLNGTLLHRPQTSNSSHFRRRALLKEFLEFLFDPKNTYKVMIWTTATPANAGHMLKNLLTDPQRDLLVASWDRKHCQLTPQMYNQKTQVYKRLEWVWENDDIQASHPQHAQVGKWDQSNTLLIDDSILKATAQPYNHILVPEFTGPKSDAGVKYGEVLEQVAGYLEEACWQSDVSSFVRESKFDVDEKVRGDSFFGGWFSNLLRREVDPSGALYDREKGGRNHFMMGYEREMMQ